MTEFGRMVTSDHEGGWQMSPLLWLSVSTAKTWMVRYYKNKKMMTVTISSLCPPRSKEEQELLICSDGGKGKGNGQEGIINKYHQNDLPLEEQADLCRSFPLVAPRCSPFLENKQT